MVCGCMTREVIILGMYILVIPLILTPAPNLFPRYLLVEATLVLCWSILRVLLEYTKSILKAQNLPSVVRSYLTEWHNSENLPISMAGFAPLIGLNYGLTMALL